MSRRLRIVQGAVGILLFGSLLFSAMGWAQTVVPKTPPTDLQVCENNRDHYLTELSRALERIYALNELNDSLVARVLSLKEQASLTVPIPRDKPVPDIRPEVVAPEACPPKTGKDKCKPGRTASPAHNCQCGRWN